MFGKKMGKVAPKMGKVAPKMVKKPVAKPVAKSPSGGTRGNVEQNYRGVPGLVNATAPVPRPVVGFPGGPGGKTTYSNDPRPVTGVINPGGAPPANSLANVGTTGFNRTMADSDLANKVAPMGMKKGGEVKASKATKASSASKRGDGIATKGKTKGSMVAMAKGGKTC